MTSTVTTPTAASIALAAPISDESPAYRYADHGRWFLSNQAALDECAAWNRYADAVNARAAARSLQHDH